jgi:hypothetical protein
MIPTKSGIVATTDENRTMLCPGSHISNIELHSLTERIWLQSVTTAYITGAHVSNIFPLTHVPNLVSSDFQLSNFRKYTT